jgi:hypothetical protein
MSAASQNHWMTQSPGLEHSLASSGMVMENSFWSSGMVYALEPYSSQLFRALPRTTPLEVETTADLLAASIGKLRVCDFLLLMIFCGNNTSM